MRKGCICFVWAMSLLAAPAGAAELVDLEGGSLEGIKLGWSGKQLVEEFQVKEETAGSPPAIWMPKRPDKRSPDLKGQRRFAVLTSSLPAGFASATVWLRENKVVLVTLVMTVPLSNDSTFAGTYSAFVSQFTVKYGAAVSGVVPQGIYQLAFEGRGGLAFREAIAWSHAGRGLSIAWADDVRNRNYALTLFSKSDFDALPRSDFQGE